MLRTADKRLVVMRRPKFICDDRLLKAAKTFVRAIGVIVSAFCPSSCVSAFQLAVSRTDNIGLTAKLYTDGRCEFLVDGHAPPNMNDFRSAGSEDEIWNGIGIDFCRANGNYEDALIVSTTFLPEGSAAPLQAFIKKNGEMQRPVKRKKTEKYPLAVGVNIDPEGWYRYKDDDEWVGMTVSLSSPTWKNYELINIGSSLLLAWCGYELSGKEGVVTLYGQEESRQTGLVLSIESVAKRVPAGC